MVDRLSVKKTYKLYIGGAHDLATEAQVAAAESVTCTVAARSAERDWADASAQSPYLIEAFCEHKTVWHPKGR